MEKELANKTKEAYTKDSELNEIARIPNNVMIEVTNSCNLRCGMCANRTMKRKKGYMTMETFKKAIDQIKELEIENVGLYTTGEAFLHPLIFDFVKYAKEVGINYVYITTNGQLLGEKGARKIIESGLDSLKFSIDGGTKEIYEKVREGGNYELLVRNIKRMKEVRDETKSKMKIYGSYIKRKGFEKDLEEFKKVFEPLLDEISYAHLTNQAGQVNVTTGKQRTLPCSFLWNRFVINYDGTLTLCCIDFDGQLNYADINKNTLKEIWNNENMKRARKYHIEGKFHLLPMCRTCISEEGVWDTE